MMLMIIITRALHAIDAAARLALEYAKAKHAQPYIK
jgi:hypothetical protein